MENIYYVFDITTPLNFVYCGKSSFSENFIHSKRIMNDYEIFLVTKGKLYINQNDYQAEILPKQMCFNLPHMFQEGYKESPCDFYWLHFTSENECVLMTEKDIKQKISENKDSFSKKAIIPRHFTLTNFELMVSLSSQLLHTVISRRQQDFEDYFITLICTEITRQVLDEFTTFKNNIPDRLNIILEDIKNTLDEKISIYTLAEKFNYSEKYLSALFKKHLGITPHKYIISQKIERSKILLNWTDSTIKEIAFVLGFDDEHHFMRLFKKYVGITASSFRKSHPYK